VNEKRQNSPKTRKLLESLNKKKKFLLAKNLINKKKGIRSKSESKQRLFFNSKRILKQKKVNIRNYNSFNILEKSFV
jgi:hypothetical protein